MSRCCAGLLSVALMIAAAHLPAQEKNAPKKESDELKTLQDKASYAIGLNIGNDLLSEGAELSPDLIAKGIRDALSKAKPALTREEINEVMGAFAKELQAKALAKAKEAGSKNKKAGEAFLAENKKLKDVTTTSTGLQYKVMKSGKGASPKKTDTVKVHYHGTLLDGTVFDSSVDRKEPAQFGVTEVIPGWTEALLKMKVGDKWKIVLPAELAYGERGAGQDIGPNAVLVFEVELLEILE